MADLFCAVGARRSSIRTAAGAPAGPALECDGAVWRLELIDGKLSVIERSVQGVHAFFPGKALDARFAQEGEEGSMGGQMKESCSKSGAMSPGAGSNGVMMETFLSMRGD